MAQRIEAKTERPLQSFWLKDFLAVNTTVARIAEPQPACFYDLTNAQPIGFSNLHSVADVSAMLHDFGSHIVYADFNVNINGDELLLIACRDGTLWWFEPATGQVGQAGSGLSGTDAIDIAQWNNTQALIIDSTGYYEFPTYIIRPPNPNPQPTGEMGPISTPGTPNTTAAPTFGNAIAVYNNIVWIAQGRTLFYSVVGDYTDFSLGTGGGLSNRDDPTLRSDIKCLFAANGYLYIFGESSIDALSDVYVVPPTSPVASPTLSFTVLNVSAVVGTDQTESIMVYGRLVLFANRYGAWMLYGTTVQSISSNDAQNSYLSNIDGTWQYLDFTNFRCAGGQVIVNRLLCAAFLVSRVNDPHMGSGNFLCMYQADAAGAKWWFADTTADVGPLTHVCTAFVDYAPALFGYIGNKLYRIFADETSALSAHAMTGLWDFGDPLSDKQAIRAGIRISVRGSVNPAVQVNVDTLTGSFPMALRDIGTIDWVNSTDQPISWANSMQALVLWNNLTRNYLQYFGRAPECYSKYLGFTVTTRRATIFELNAFLLDYKLAARWASGDGN
jgi:hypothetical protein